MKRIAFLLPLMAAVAAAPLHSQQQTSGTEINAKGHRTIAPLLAINFPTSDLGEAAATGWGLALQGTMGQGAFALIGEIGYDMFGVDVGDFPEESRARSSASPLNFNRTRAIDYSDDIGVWHFGAGLRLKLGPIYGGGLAGFWTEVDDFDVVPLVGIHIWKLDVGARYKGLLGDGDWVALTGAFHISLK